MNTGPVKSISADDLKCELLKMKYAEMLAKPEVFPSEKNWQYIIEHAMGDIGHELYRKYLVSWLMPEENRSMYHTIALREFPRYIAAVPREYALEVVYADTESSVEAFEAVVDSQNLFDSRKIINLIQNGLYDAAFVALKAYQPEYTKADIREMRELESILRNLPPSGRIEDRRNMFRTDERYICPKGHSNPASETFCREASCRQNIYGLTPEQVSVMNHYFVKVGTLLRLAEML